MGVHLRVGGRRRWSMMMVVGAMVGVWLSGFSCRGLAVRVWLSGLGRAWRESAAGERGGRLAGERGGKLAGERGGRLAGGRGGRLALPPAEARATSLDGAGASLMGGCLPAKPILGARIIGGSDGATTASTVSSERRERGEESAEEGEESGRLSERTEVVTPSAEWCSGGEAGEKSPIPAALIAATMKRYAWPGERLPTRAHGSGESVVSMPTCQVIPPSMEKRSWYAESSGSPPAGGGGAFHQRWTPPAPSGTQVMSCGADGRCRFARCCVWKLLAEKHLREGVGGGRGGEGGRVGGGACGGGGV